MFCCLHDGIGRGHGRGRDILVLEDDGLGAAFCSCVGEPAEVISVMVQGRCEVMAGATFCAPRLAFAGVVQHLDFNSQWGKGMAVEIVLSVQYCPRADFWGNV